MSCFPRFRSIRALGSIGTGTALSGIALTGSLIYSAEFAATAQTTSPSLKPGPQQPASQPPQYLPIEAQWCVAPAKCIQLEVPRGERQFSFGLQLRPPLKPLQGMWFDFGSPVLARFWMHRTPAALDMLFIKGSKVVAIEANTKPCMHLPCPSYGPDEQVESVVELGAGQAEALGIKVGSPAVIERFQPRQP
jgi:uncharacterized membrane protein (UPF0127 family)